MYRLNCGACSMVHKLQVVRFLDYFFQGWHTGLTARPVHTCPHETAGRDTNRRES